MGKQEWKRLYDAQSLLNGEDAIREMVRNGTYEGQRPIRDEYELDQMVKQARREEQAGRMFHFENYLNNYDTGNYSVESDEDRMARNDAENESAARPWWKLW